MGDKQDWGPELKLELIPLELELIILGLSGIGIGIDTILAHTKNQFNCLTAKNSFNVRLCSFLLNRFQNNNLFFFYYLRNFILN